MRLATAGELRKRTVEVPIAGTDMVIKCRKPDLMAMISQGLLSLELYEIAKRASERTTEENEHITMDVAADYAKFIDAWVCAAAVAPRVVLTARQAEEDPHAVWVEDLDLPTKLLILNKTTPATKVSLPSGAAEFRSGEPESATTGSASPAVRDETEQPTTH